MKKFIEEILNNQTFLDVLYNFGIKESDLIYIDKKDILEILNK